jgi:UDP-N-acetylglucosamine acyltransferase
VATIHPTAVVADGARLGADVEIGAYASVGPDAVLGDGVKLHDHAVVTGHTTIGAATEVHPFAVIGGAPQDVSYKGDPTRVVVGERCIIREHVTIHRGTMRGKQVTTVGSNCFFMVGAHIAHDCVIGNGVTFVNNATIGGHVEVGDFAILGGLSAIHQRIRIGAYAFVGGLSGVGGDLIPFGTATGRGARLAGLNIVGLKRRGFDRQSIHALRGAVKVLFAPGAHPSTRVDQVLAECGEAQTVKLVAEFIRKGGLARLCVPTGESDEDGFNESGDDGA